MMDALARQGDCASTLLDEANGRRDCTLSRAGLSVAAIPAIVRKVGPSMRLRRVFADCRNGGRRRSKPKARSQSPGFPGNLVEGEALRRQRASCLEDGSPYPSIIEVTGRETRP